MLDIKPMSLQDLESIKDILCSDFDDFWNYNILKSDFENSSTKYIVAKIKNEIVGFAGILDTVDQYEITNIVVKKDKRNKGIGNLLLNSIISFAKCSNKDKIYLEVNEKNLTAISIYEKNGFKKCGLRKKYYKNIDDAILMTLNLK